MCNNACQVDMVKRQGITVCLICVNLTISSRTWDSFWWKCTSREQLNGWKERLAMVQYCSLLWYRDRIPHYVSVSLQLAQFPYELDWTHRLYSISYNQCRLCRLNSTCSTNFTQRIWWPQIIQMIHRKECTMTSCNAVQYSVYTVAQSLLCECSPHLLGHKLLQKLIIKDSFVCPMPGNFKLNALIQNQLGNVCSN